jgi:hypothetical protein
MSKKLISTIFIAAFIGIFAIRPELSAMELDGTSSLECDGGIVLPGDSEDNVRDKCGDPQKVTREDADSPVVWQYNFGPTEFVYYVSFTDGVVERIQMGNYGN